MFKSMTDFEVTFVQSGRLPKDSFCACVYGCPFIPSLRREKAIFPPMNCFCTFVKNSVEHFCVILSLSPVLSSTDLCANPSANAI